MVGLEEKQNHFLKRWVMTKPNIRKRYTGALLTVLLILGVAIAEAQEEVGALYGTVTDTTGTVLPGVSVSLTGMGGERIQVSDALGKFRFLRLDPGLFRLAADLDGFSPLTYPEITIRAGRNTTLQLQLDAAIQDVVTVTAESPLLDERQLIEGTTLEKIDLSSIPTSGDPWAVLIMAPGVLTDRIDIGGTRAQQSTYTAPGVPFDQGSFVLDGADVTHPVGGESATYFDFEQFEQIDISTGGNDITKMTAGASISLVTSRGTNELRGTARYLITDDDLFWFFTESDPDVDASEFPPGQEGVETTQIDSIRNYGFELGGPLLQDRLWLWGSYGNNDTSEIKINGYPQHSPLESVALKVNAQLSHANSLVTSWNNTDKQIQNRGAGASRAWEATWFQRGPNALFKLEDSHVFSSNVFLSGMWAKLDGGFSITANGCIEAGGCDVAAEYLWDADGIDKNSMISGYVRNPSDEYRLDGSYFFGTGNTSHELRFGGNYRKINADDVLLWPGGREVFHYAGALLGLPDGLGVFGAQRGTGTPSTIEHRGLWIQDTLAWSAWTINLGLRYDHSDGRNDPLSIAANPAVPEYLPAIEFAGNDAGGFDWQTVSPRVGVTYALGEERRTLVRASYARFAQALTWNDLARTTPVDRVYAYFYFADANGDNMWQENEENLGLAWTWNYDPANPTSLETPNRTDPGLDPDITDEVVLGIQHSFWPELVADFNVTWRNRSDIHDTRDLVRDCETETCDSEPVRAARRDDYLYYDSVEVVHPDGLPYAVDFYRLGSELMLTGGNLLINGDRQVEYLGATLSLTKRLANRWMLRGFLNYGRPEWRIPESFSEFDDPTDNDAFDSNSVDNDGQLFAQGGGRWFELVMHSNWSFNINGLVQIAPARIWGFDVAGNVYGREGYPRPLNTRAFIPGERWKWAQAVEDPEDFRYADVFTFDLRFDKEIAVTNDLSLGLIADLFNVFNSGVVLEKDNWLNGPQENYVLENLSPRIWRLGLRLNWR